MQSLLSVLLPVRNAQSTLKDSVEQILDAAADTGRRFELLIIDDGSSDATSEVAHELTRHFPQVRLVRHKMPLGHEAAVRTGLERSRGEAVVVRDGCPGGFRVIERLPEKEGRSPFVRRPCQHGARLRAVPANGDRPLFSSSRPARPNFLRRLKSFALGE